MDHRLHEDRVGYGRGGRRDAKRPRRLVSVATRSFGEACDFALSVPLCLEYEAVLTRRSHLSATGATSREMIWLIDALAAVAEPVEISFLWRPTLSDPSAMRWFSKPR